MFLHLSTNVGQKCFLHTEKMLKHVNPFITKEIGAIIYNLLAACAVQHSLCFSETVSDFLEFRREKQMSSLNLKKKS
jgi:hypothetical protein